FCAGNLSACDGRTRQSERKAGRKARLRSQKGGLCRRCMMIDGETKLIAHIGYPTESFKSPLIYNPFFAARKINAAVVPMGCRSEDYATFLKLLFKLSNVHGALITMPHKRTTLALVDEASVSARIAGGCNAVRMDERGRLIGDMFDGEGFVRGLQ